MKATIEARIYFEPDQPGRLYMKSHYVDEWTGLKNWCPKHVSGEARWAVSRALVAIGATTHTAAGIKEMIYKIELNSNYPRYGKSMFPLIIPGI